MRQEKPKHSSLVEAYEASVDANDYIEAVDSAIVAGGRTMAKRIQDAVDEGEGQEVTKALYLMPHLMNILKEMAATPVSRKTLEREEKKAQVDEKAGETGGSSLSKFRSITGGKAS